MSRILRRPMFRGGQVIDSRGTGITSGLMDGGRVGYDSGDLVTGGKLVKDATIPLDFNTLANTKFSAAVPFGYTSPVINQGGAAEKTIKEKVEEKVEEAPQKVSMIDDFSMSEMPYDVIPSEQDILTNKLQSITKKANDGKFLDKEERELAEKYGIVYGRDLFDNEDRASIEEKNINLAKTAEIKPDVVKTENNEPSVIEKLNLEGEEKPEIDAKTAVEENKKLFAELLGADKARGQDIGDMLLRFAAAPGSTTQEKFQTYLQAESQAGKGRAEKINETAAALAINDYVAGKRSKEQIKQLKEVATFKDSLGNKFTENLIKIAGPGTIPNASHIESALRTTYPGKNVTRYKSTDEVKTTAADTGTFLLEEDTKRAFLIVDGTTGKKKQVY